MGFIIGMSNFIGTKCSPIVIGGETIDVNIVNDGPIDVSLGDTPINVLVDWDNMPMPKKVISVDFGCLYNELPAVVQTCDDGTFTIFLCDENGILTEVPEPNIKLLKCTEELVTTKKTITEIIRLDGCQEGVIATPFTFPSGTGTIGDTYELTGEYLSWQIISSPATAPNSVLSIGDIGYKINCNSMLPSRCSDSPICEDITFIAGDKGFFEIMVVRCAPE